MSRARTCAVLALLLTCSAPCVRADTTIVTKTILDGHESVVREFRQGKNFRTEDMRGPGNTGTVTIFNFDRRAIYRLDEQAKHYTEMNGPDILARFAAWLRRGRQIEESGKIVDVYYETIDTGERRQQFGRTVRHLVIHERHIPEPGACSASFEIDRDGWYFVPSHSGPARMTYILASGGYQCRDRTVRHGLSTYPGFPIRETTTTRYPAFSSTDIREVVEYSTEPLDKWLFEIPKDFKRVEDVSWTERIEYDWSQFEEAAASWF